MKLTTENYFFYRFFSGSVHSDHFKGIEDFKGIIFFLNFSFRRLLGIRLLCMFCLISKLLIKQFWIISPNSRIKKNIFLTTAVMKLIHAGPAVNICVTQWIPFNQLMNGGSSPDHEWIHGCIINEYTIYIIHS